MNLLSTSWQTFTRDETKLSINDSEFCRGVKVYQRAKMRNFSLLSRHTSLDLKSRQIKESNLQSSWDFTNFKRRRNLRNLTLQRQHCLCKDKQLRASAPTIKNQIILEHVDRRLSVTLFNAYDAKEKKPRDKIPRNRVKIRAYVSVDRFQREKGRELFDVPGYEILSISRRSTEFDLASAISPLHPPFSLRSFLPLVGRLLRRTTMHTRG